MSAMRISQAAQALGMSPRMLRYRERLGLVPRGRTDPWWRSRPGSTDSAPGSGHPRAQARDRTSHRQYTEEDVRTITLAVQMEEKYDVTPLAVAFALRAFTEPAVGAAVRELAERLGRLPTSARASEIDKERALRWLGRSGVLQPPSPRPR